MLELLMPKLISASDTYRAISYKGIGKLPKNITSTGDPKKRILLQELPRLLKGYGQTYPSSNTSYPVIVIVVCDLDSKNYELFMQELNNLLNGCSSKPNAFFCLAVEEGEAWLLGDKKAVIAAYPKIDKTMLSSYQYDSICGTWEYLANSISKGFAAKLASEGYQAIGKEKSKWAEKITPNIEIDRNLSPSFKTFANTVRDNCKTK